jgi:hypothetical protein
MFSALDSSNATMGFFTPLKTNDWVLLEKIEEKNIDLENPELIKEYKENLFKNKLEKIFNNFGDSNTGSFLAFYSSALQSYANKVLFATFIENNSSLIMNQICRKYAVTLKEFAACIFGVNKDVFLENEGYKLYQLVLSAKNEIEAIKHISKHDFMRLDIFAIQKKHIKDLNPLYYSEKLPSQSQKLIGDWLQQGDFNKIAELSKAMADKKWYEVVCIIEKNKKVEDGNNLNLSFSS